MHLIETPYLSLFDAGLTEHGYDLLGHHIYEQTLSICCFLRSLILWDLEGNSEFVILSEPVSLLIYVNAGTTIVSFLFYVSKSGCLLPYILGTLLPECEYFEIFLLVARKSIWAEGTQN